MSSPPLDLTGFLLLLGSRPDPQTALDGLVNGPLARFGARAGILVASIGADLVIIADLGYEPIEVEPYRVMAATGAYPIAHAFREQTVLISAVTTVVPEYAGLQRDDDLWEQVWSRHGYGSLVSAPIVLQGRSIGAYGFTCVDDRDWSTLEVAELEAYGAALGLWLQPTTSVDSVPTATLTARQVAVLQQIRAGRSNSAIAAALSISESTVKGDVRRACATLGVTTRAAAAERAHDLGLL
jgi:DNA-binding CsgD family transcriptional regulator